MGLLAAVYGVSQRCIGDQHRQPRGSWLCVRDDGCRTSPPSSHARRLETQALSIPCELLRRHLANSIQTISAPSYPIFDGSRQRRWIASCTDPLRHDWRGGFRSREVANRVRVFICVTGGVSDVPQNLYSASEARKLLTSQNAL